MKEQFYVYILANYNNSCTYIRVTNNLIRRVYEHKNKIIEGFTKKYNITKLVYFEIYQDIENAILREKQLKNWNKAKKRNLIETKNKEYNDLYELITK